MGAFIAKQPNGLYCRFSTCVDCPTDWNMTRNDYIQMCVDKAIVEANRTLDESTKPFSEVSKMFLAQNMTRKKFKEIIEDCKVDASACKKQSY